jgi:hypothetical protein
MAKATTKAKKAKAETSEQRRQRQIEHILAQVASGRNVSKVLREDDDMPSKTEFWRWHFSDETLRGNLADARANGVEAILDECAEIADDGSNDTYRDDKGFLRTDHDVIARSKLRIETRVKMAQMMKPKAYGPKLDLTSGGEKIEDLDPVARASRLASIMSGIEKRVRGDDATE